MTPRLPKVKRPLPNDEQGAVGLNPPPPARIGLTLPEGPIYRGL
jgi:hypothetical protein